MHKKTETVWWKNKQNRTETLEESKAYGDCEIYGVDDGEDLNSFIFLLLLLLLLQVMSNRATQSTW